MSDFPFYSTRMGRQFYEASVPAIDKALECTAVALEG